MDSQEQQRAGRGVDQADATSAHVAATGPAPGPASAPPAGPRRAGGGRDGDFDTVPDPEALAERRGIEMAEDRGVSGFEALIDATLARDATRLRGLLAAGADNGWRAPTGRTALMFVVEDDQPAALDFARELIAGGESLEARDLGGRTALAAASRRGRHEMVELLLDAGAQADSTDNLGRTALMHAAESGSGRTIEALARTGVDPNAVDHNGRGALAHAAQAWRLESAQALLRAGADPLLVDHRRESPLSLARRSGHKGMLEALEAAAADRENEARAGLPPVASLAGGHRERQASAASAREAERAQSAAQQASAAPALPTAAASPAVAPAAGSARPAQGRGLSM